MSELFDRQVFPDRPWTGRGYGRIKLSEPMARDLYNILKEEVRMRLEEYHEAAKEGDASVEKAALRRVSEMRKRVGTLLMEQGWQDRGTQET